MERGKPSIKDEGGLGRELCILLVERGRRGAVAGIADQIAG